MRHGKKLNHLGRKSGHRRALMANMASSLIKHKKITTTVAKAKALRIYVEPLITKSKEKTTTNFRTVFSYLQDKEAVTELFGVVSDKISQRPGGYTRILKVGNRAGDNADMALIELVDFNEYFSGFGTDKKADSKRTRRGRGKSSAESGASAKVVDTVVTAPAVEIASEEIAEAEVETVTETAVETPVEATPLAVAETIEAESDVVATEETPVAEPIAESNTEDAISDETPTDDGDSNDEPKA